MSRQFMFGYRIRISNEGSEPAKLLARHWIIIDSHGRRRDVEGDGVIGQQPRIEPGQTFEYTSQCPLTTSWGTMEGTYRMTRDDGEEFEARVGRFYLVSEEGGPARV
jgi:ApaG protein